MYKNKLLVIPALLTLIYSCKKDVPPERPTENVTLGSTGGVFVVNEGNYAFGNAKLSYYNKSENSTVVDLFEQTNGMGVGDVLQSMYIFNQHAYLIVNNSGKIEVCDPVTLQKTASISGLTSPRYFLPVSNNKAYVTDIYANKIWKIDLVNNSITGSIQLNGWSEQMTSVFGETFIANFTNGKVYVLDESTDILTDSIVLTKGASSIVQDANGKLWVLCAGDATSSISPALYKINPTTRNIEFSQTLSGSPSRLCVNGTSDTLYFLNSGVFQLSINSAIIPTTPVITQGTANFYGLGIDPQTSLIYVSDAIDYIQYGKILIYKPNGIYVKEFDAGIIPGDFWFQ